MRRAESTVESEAGVGADEDALTRGWLRVAAGLAVAGQAMVFSLAVNLTPAEGGAYWLVHGGLLASALAVLLFLGRDLCAEAWRALRERRVSIDLLFLTTLSGALVGSVIGSATGEGSVYYEVVAVLLVVHTLGRMAAARSRAAALRAAGELARRFERCTVMCEDGRLEARVAAGVGPGERVVVTPGEAISVDGEIIEGRSYIEEAALTGEWRPVSRGPGDAVWAGTHAVDGRLLVATRGGARRLDTMLRAVEEARLAPSVLQAQADRLIAWFLPVVITVSALTCLGWMLADAGWARALFNGMAVLLVACPCAMGLATPVAVWGGLARLARLGVVARGGDFLDGLARVDMACFDKTGTLSEDRLEVAEWTAEPGWEARLGELRAAVGALERGLAHPVARALATEAGGPVVGEVRVEAGRGVAARVDGLGEVRVGEREFCGVDTGGPGAGKAVWVAVAGRPVARVRLRERWREGAAETLAELAGLGVTVEILTGDPTPERVGAPWAEGTEVRAGLAPTAKAERVEQLAKEGHTVLFAGDGVNDAGALSAAHCALALRGGSDLARAAAMAVCAGEDLRRLPEAIRVARRVRAGVKANLRFAATYNAAGMALAAAGMLHPVAAALLMVGSSVWVGARAMRSAER